MPVTIPGRRLSVVLVAAAAVLIVASGSAPALAASTPGPPTGVSAKPGVRSATVSFTAPSSHGSSPITSYTAACVSSNGGTAGAASGAHSPLVVAGLTAEKTYTCRVHATNASGSGAESAPSKTVVPFTTPGAPGGVRAAASAGRITVRFSPPTSNGGSTISRYTATCTSPDGGPTRTAGGSSSPLTVTDIPDNTTYACAVVATNPAGTGPASGPSNLAERAVISASGGSATVTLKGVPAGRRVSVTLDDPTFTTSCSSKQLTLRRGGAVLADAGCLGSEDAFLDVTTLSSAGDYTVVLAPTAPHTGSGNLAVFTVADKTGTITPTASGGSQSVSITTPGQKATFSFSGSAGQRISAALTGSLPLACNSGQFTLRRGSTVLADAGCTGGSEVTFLDATGLPADGLYTIVVDPAVADTGTETLTAYSVVDQTGTITPTTSGGSQSAAITTPGKKATFSFTGKAGQRLSATLTGSLPLACNSGQFTLRRGTTVLADAGCTGGSELTLLDATTLPANGTYTIVIDPAGPNTGTEKLKAYTVVDQTGTITPTAAGASQSVSITTPGKKATFSFTGKAGQRIRATLAGSLPLACNSGQFTLRRGTTVLADAGCTGGSELTVLPTTTLPANGTYTIVIDPAGASTGNETLKAYTVANS